MSLRVLDQAGLGQLGALLRGAARQPATGDIAATRLNAASRASGVDAETIWDRIHFCMGQGFSLEPQSAGAPADAGAGDVGLAAGAGLGFGFEEAAIAGVGATETGDPASGLSVVACVSWGAGPASPADAGCGQRGSGMVACSPDGMGSVSGSCKNAVGGGARRAATQPPSAAESATRARAPEPHRTGLLRYVSTHSRLYA